jgi:hypothetical protein
VILGGAGTEWERVTLESDLRMDDGAISVRKQMSLNSRLSMVDSILVVGGNSEKQTLSGRGEVVFEHRLNTLNEIRTGGSDSTRATFAHGLTIRNGSGSGVIVGTFDNHATISAETAGRFLSVRGNQWRNMPSGIMQAIDGGVLYLGGATTTANLLGGTVRNAGGSVVLDLQLDNAGADLALDRNTGTWTLGSFGRVSGGNVRWSDGARLQFEGGALADVTVRSDLRMSGREALTLIGQTRIGQPEAPVVADTAGSLHASGNETRVDAHTSGPWRIGEDGLLSVDAGAVVRPHDGLEVSGRVAVYAGSSLVFPGGASFDQIAGSVSIDGSLEATLIDLIGGVFSGGGIVNGNVIAAAKVRPGGWEGTALTVAGSYTQEGSGELVIDLNGLGLGEAGLLKVVGDTHLAGTLVLERGGAYSPSIGDSFLILVTTGTRTGDFSEVRALGFDSPFRFVTEWEQEGLRVTVAAVPEPATRLSLLAGLSLLWIVRGRRRSRLAFRGLA